MRSSPRPASLPRPMSPAVSSRAWSLASKRSAASSSLSALVLLQCNSLESAPLTCFLVLSLAASRVGCVPGHAQQRRECPLCQPIAVVVVIVVVGLLGRADSVLARPLLAGGPPYVGLRAFRSTRASGIQGEESLPMMRKRGRLAGRARHSPLIITHYPPPS